MTDKPKFVPNTSTDKEQAEKSIQSEVDKAKEAADIQEYETKKIKAKQEAIFAENQIENVEHLLSKMQALSEKEIQFERDTKEWESNKAVEQSEIDKKKSELEAQEAELNKFAQKLAARETNLELRESMFTEREEILNSIERQKLEETERRNTITAQLEQSFKDIKTLMCKNANILMRAGFRKLGDNMWDELEEMENLVNNELDKHTDYIVDTLKNEIGICNEKAVIMSRNAKEYGERKYNLIVDNLEKIYELLPIAKLEHLPSDEEL